MSIYFGCFFIPGKFLNFMYNVMKAKRIEVSALLRVGSKQTEISKQSNVSRMTVYRVAQRLKDSKSFQDRPRLGRPQVIRRGTFKKAFENDSEQKMTRLA